jgi:hypothetical protein
MSAIITMDDLERVARDANEADPSPETLREEFLAAGIRTTTARPIPSSAKPKPGRPTARSGASTTGRAPTKKLHLKPLLGRVS